MNILIDTNILLYILFESHKLSNKDKYYIFDPNNLIFVSAISLFEISLKYAIGKLTLNKTKPDEIAAILLENNYIIQDIHYKSFANFYKLPLKQHKDPFDRILIWEAIHKGQALLSRDSEFKEYIEDGLTLL